MAFSSDVTAGDTILASHYNNLRKDVLDTVGGHTHSGADSKTLAINSVDTAQLVNDSVTGDKIDTTVADNSTIELSGTTLRVKDNGLLSAKLNLTTTNLTKSSYTLSGSGTVYWTPTAGIYTIVSGSVFTVEIYVGGSWRATPGSNYTTGIITDGTNVRIGGGNTQVIYYIKY